MRHIVKGPPPADLVATAKATTTNLTTPAGARTASDQIDKHGARRLLAREQGHLCAFCMRRIDPDAKDTAGQATLKIAHRVPVNADPTLALSRANLLGSCDGGQSSGTAVRTCDAAQGDTPLTVDPTQPESVARLRYESHDAREGLFITSADPELRADVETSLGLNRGELPANRAAAWKAFQVDTRKRFPKGPYGRDAWRRRLEERRAEAGARLPPYFGVLESKLRV